MKKESLALLKALSLIDGVPGFEEDVRAFVRSELQGLGTLEMDNLGSLVCKKVGRKGGPRIMLPAHMDEIGFMVKDITAQGYLKFAPLGGWLDQTLLAHVMTVRTRKGDRTGVVGCTPPHIMPPAARDKVIKRTTMFIDIGATDKAAAEKMGVRIGDPIVPKQGYERIGDKKHLLGKAWDDRTGVALMIDVMRALKGASHPNVVYGVATVQEEVGTRGAETSADVVNPDFCITLDVGLATDMPGAEKETRVNLGGGPILYVLDGGTISHHKFHAFLVEVAERNGIPYQLSLLERGATDARAIHLHKRGVPSVPLGIPSRYIHSHAGIIHTDDYDATLRLVLAALKALTPARAKKLALV
jgi:putative aminopeptidase FrvX